MISRTPTQLIEVEGWLTDSPDVLRLHLSGEVRRWSFAAQVRCDLCRWPSWAFWISGGLCVALVLVGPLARHLAAWPIAFCGLVMWGIYTFMLWTTVRGRQRTQVFEATIRFDQSHPLYRDFMTGGYETQDGSARGRATLPEWAVTATRRADGTHQALVAAQPGAQFGYVVGVRPVQRVKP